MEGPKAERANEPHAHKTQRFPPLILADDEDFRNSTLPSTSATGVRGRSAQSMSSNKAGKKRANPRDEDEAMLDSQFAAADSSDEEDDDEDEDDEEESSDDGEEIVEGDEGEEEGEEPTAMDGARAAEGQEARPARAE